MILFYYVCDAHPRNIELPPVNDSTFYMKRNEIGDDSLSYSRTMCSTNPCLIIASLMTTSSTNQDTFRSYRISFIPPSVVFLT